MNALISLLFQRKKKPKDRSVTSALINDGIVGMINLAAPPTQEKLKAAKGKQEKQVEEEKEEKRVKQEKKKEKQAEKEEKKKEKQAEEAKEEKRVKQEKKKEKLVEEVKQDKKKEKQGEVVKEKQAEEVKEEKKQDKEGTPATVRKRNKRHLKVTIAPGTMTSESAEKVHSTVKLHQIQMPLRNTRRSVTGCPSALRSSSDRVWISDVAGLRAMSVSRPRLRERSASEESPSELSTSPFPGDTLPWNLAKHQRVKRSKSASGDVLDPAERAVIRIAGKR
ncbi:hypothetical protein AOLI_G00321480 [Acnodon oligacanthus]